MAGAIVREFPPYFSGDHGHRLVRLLSAHGTEWEWEQVVGNIVSEWLQMAGLVFMTKKLIERGSKESR